MKVSGRMRVEPSGPNGPDESILDQPEDESDDDDNGDDDALSAPKPLSTSSFCTFRFRSPHTPTKAINQQLWQPFADFISRCPGLKCVIWMCDDQVPRCILDTLQRQIPTCRLQVNTFWLRSLIQYKEGFQDIDPDEYALITSPNLSGISGMCAPFNAHGINDYNEEAILRVVAELAPNLRSVCSYRLPWVAFPILRSARRARPPWQGFFTAGGTTFPKTTGQLTKLSLSGYGFSDPLQLQTWIEYTDFSKLHFVALNSPQLEEGNWQILNRLAENDTFTCLRAVSIALTQVDYEQSMFRFDTAYKFLCSLRPLEGMEIAHGGLYELPEHMTDILEHHGASLKRLCIPYPVSEATLVEIGEKCPKLQELEIGVKRSQGNEQEVRTYMILGKLLKLEPLTLLWAVDALDLFEFEDEEGKIERAEMEKHLRSNFINCAIDANLAQSIFNVILRSSRSNRPGLVPSFRCLKLRHGFNRYGDDEMFEQLELLQGWLQRSWVCERERADAFSDKAILREVDVCERLLDLESFKEFLKDETNDIADDESDDRALGDLFRLAWEAVWPESRGKEDWFEEWQSFPLWQES